jgi:endonuclease-3 related protein
MPNITAKHRLLNEIFNAAFAHFGPRYWWPGDTGEEIVIGAVLTQNTAWSNVEKAIANLGKAEKLSLGAIDRSRQQTIARLIRPSGYFNLKAKRLKAVARFFAQRCGCDLSALRGEDPRSLREDLLQVYGVGEETADSILLYALDMPVFVIDAYTKRIASRHGLCPDDVAYGDLQKVFESNLPSDRQLFNEFHALLVAIGHNFCRPKPLCESCPLFQEHLFLTKKSLRKTRQTVCLRRRE